MINKIKGMRLLTDCSFPSNEEQQIEKAKCSAYNQAIEDVVKLLESESNEKGTLGEEFKGFM